jgi:restriction endonuclease S subunit
LFDLHGEYVFASYLIRLRPIPELLPEYLNIFINSYIGQSRIRIHVSRGVSQANISASNLRRVSLRVPSLEVQQAVVREHAALSESTLLAMRAEQATRHLAYQLRAAVFGGAGT